MVDKNKQLLYERQAQIAGAVAHPLRIAILDFLKDGDQCVCDIADYIGSERSNVSKHLTIMVNSGLLEYRKEGLKVVYSLKCKCIMDFFTCAVKVLKHQAKETQSLLKTI